MEAQTSALDELYPEQAPILDNHTLLFSSDPEQAYREAQRLVKVVASRCTGPGYLVNIRGKQYPKIEWWTSVSASLGVFPQVVYSKRIDREDEIAYEAKVEVHRNGQVLSSGEALCSSKEARWQNADEYAIKSMAITRASGKAYRIPLSFLAVMAGLEVTPAEEMPMEVTPETKSINEQPATEKQLDKLGELLNDDRLTLEEQTRLRGALIKGLSKSRASEIMAYFFGESRKKNGSWEKICAGVLQNRKEGK
jgi:hypothetical protein